MRTQGKFAVLTFYCFAATAQTWKPLNQGLPTAVSGVIRIAVSTDGAVAYAISSQGGLLRKDGQSAKWKPLDEVVGVSTVALAAGPNPMVYAATNAGIRMSSDNGKTWKSAGSANAQVAGIASIAVAPGNAETAYAAAGGQILKTTDGGQTWAATSSFANGAAVTVSLDPVNPSTLYASSVFGAIFKTVDGGQTWTAIKAPLKDSSFGAAGLRLSVDPKNPATLYAGSFAAFLDPTGPFLPGPGTISKSSDGGQTWTAISAGIPPGAFVGPPQLDPASSSVLYAGFYADFGGSSNSGGVLKSTDGGNTWSQVYTTPDDVLDICAGAGVLYAGLLTSDEQGGGIVTSTDGGQAWTASNQGLNYFDLRTLALDPSDAGEVYAGGSSGLFKKSKGTAFASLPVPAPIIPGQPGATQADGVVSVTLDPANPQVLYANVSSPTGCAYYYQLLFKSTDGGNTWNNVSPQDSGCILFNAPMLVESQSHAVYLAANDDIDGGFNLLKSTDGGATWYSNWSNDASQVNVLVEGPAVNNAATLYAGLLTGLFKSSDEGATWTAAGLANINLTALAIDLTEPKTLFASSAQSIYKSTDGGATWNPVNQGLARLATAGASIKALAIDPGNDSIVYAATSGAGIYRSADGGATWASFNEGLTNRNVRSLAASAVDHQSIYALTAGGVFKLAKQ